MVRKALLFTMENKQNKPRILFVDDTQQFREMFAAVLGARGYDYRIAAGPGEAIAIAEAEGVKAYNLVITDNEMPGGGGIKLVRYLREVGYTGPIIVNSSNVAASLELEYRSYGVEHFLIKTCPVEEIFDTIEAATR
jgi:CheY-like chemotaxis protein